MASLTRQNRVSSGSLSKPTAAVGAWTMVAAVIVVVVGFLHLFRHPRLERSSHGGSRALREERGRTDKASKEADELAAEYDLGVGGGCCCVIL